MVVAVLQVNGKDVSPSEYSITEKDLTLAKLPAGPITLNVVTEIKPQENSSLEGLYKSSGNFCTQVCVCVCLIQHMSMKTSRV